MTNGFDPEFATPADWASLYRMQGIQVVPGFMPNEHKSWKRPLLKSWTEFQEALVPDSVFLQWYGVGGQYASRQNMGVICGRASHNVFVIDLDIHKTQAAAQWWAGLLAIHNNNMELETVTQRTGGGGLQLLFEAPMQWSAPTNKTTIGVDIRGQGGFAVLCPSIHESGKAYEWLEGRSPAERRIQMAPDWLLEAVEDVVRKYGGVISPPGGNGPLPAPMAQEDGFGALIDGREDKMFRMVFRIFMKMYRECPIGPLPPELSLRRAREEYEIYERKVEPQRLHPPGLTKTEMLNQEDRGWEAFHVKWDRLMKRWDTKVREEANKPDPHPEEEEPEQIQAKAEQHAKTNPASGLYELLSVRDIKTMPDPVWLIHGLVVDQSMGFIYGPPGCLKTFIGLDIALSLTTNRTLWWGRPIQRNGAVVYISSEGQADLKFRIMAWEKQNKTSTDDAPFFLIRQSINFMKPEDIGRLLATVQSVANHTPVAAVFVDTVSRVLPGAEENLQKDMTLFVAACDAVRQRFGAVVFGLHHTNKNGTMRGSTVMPGAGDFILEVRREPGAMTGSIFAFKVKAAEDGWEQNFKVEKIDLSGTIGRTSLALHPVGEPPKREGGRGWPEHHICREILAAIHEQWVNKDPWCYSTNTSRSALTNIMQKWNLKRPAVKDMLDKWNAEGVIAEETYDTKSKLRGYRKLLDI